MAGEGLLARWLPGNEPELQAALQMGELPEGHWLDMKQELGSKPADNKELASDLASFAIDGGAVILGVAEDKQTGALVTHPIVLKGLKERIDQVARNRVDPPLAVRITEIRSAADPTVGHVVVWVPPSPDAPHAVDGRYRGRGDTTKHVLGDAEVRRIMALRHNTLDVERLVDLEIDRDPYPGTTAGHLFIVAQPVSADSELLLDAVREKGWRHWLDGLAGRLSSPSRFVPDFPDWAGTTSLRSGAAARHNSSTSQARSRANDARAEEQSLDVEFREDGGIRLFCGRATMETVINGATSREMFLDLIGGLTTRTVAAAAVIAETTGYLGAWGFGIAITNVEAAPFGGWPRHAVYSDPEYRTSCIATTEDLLDRPALIEGRLLNRLWRTAGLTEITP